MRKGIYKDRKRNTWYIQTRIKINSSYKSCTIRGYPSKSAANADYERAIAEWIKRHVDHCELLFFKELIDEVRKDRATTVKIQTLRADDSIYSKYLLKTFGNDLIENVFKKDRIMCWYEKFISNNQISVQRKNKVITRFKDILAYAYKHLLCDAPTYQICDVVLKRLRVNIVQKVEKKIWSREEYEKFLNIIPTDQIWYPLFVLFGELGCRIGELQGLTWKNFDIKEGTIFICQQVVEGTGQGHYIIETPKTASSIRHNRLTKNTFELLLELKQITNAPEEFFIFGGKRPISRNAIRKALYKYSNIAKLRKITPHSLRHSNASWLVSTVKTIEDVKIISNRLGHASTQMTLDTYSHVLQSRENDMIKILGSNLRNLKNLKA